MSGSLLQVQFQGVDEGSDPKALPPGTLLTAKNCAMDKARRLVKRKGTASLSKQTLQSTTITAGQRLLSRGQDVGVIDGQIAYAYVDTLSKWQSLDRPPNLRVSRRGLIDSTRSVAAVDTAIYGDMLIMFYEAGVSTSGAPMFVQVVSRTTNEQLLPPLIIYSAAKGPRVLVSGASAYLFATTTAGVIRMQILDLASLSLGGVANVVSDASTSPAPFDAVISGTVLYLAYEKASGTNRTTIADFTLSTLVAIHTPLNYLGTGVLSICLAAGASSVYLAYALSGSSQLCTATATLTATSGPSAIAAVSTNYVFVAEFSATQVLVGIQRSSGSTDSERIITALYTTATGAIVSNTTRTTFGLFAPSKPWSVASRWYVAALAFLHPYSTTSTDDIPTASTVVIEIETATSLTGITAGTHVHVAMLENQTGWYASGYFTLLKASVDSDGAIYIPSPYRNREPGDFATPLPIGWNVYRLAVNEGDLFGQAKLGPGALCAGGAPAWYDGVTLNPYGFAHAPVIISVTAAAGGAVVEGTYSYVATYAWKDGNGVLHRSMPSPPKSGATSGSDLSLTVKISTSSLSSKQRALFGVTVPSPVMIELWRTTIGGTGAHYRLTLEPIYQLLVNDPQAGDVSLTDTKADANIASGSPATTLASQPQLYTDLGELENVPPPAFITVATHRGRLAGIGPDLRTVWLSKDSTIDASLAPGFNEALTLAFAADKTALASLDEKLVVFGGAGIDVVHGDGPSDTGDQNTWQIQAVQTDVGCTNPRSVVTSPLGVLFESRRGIELLDRGLNVVWVGKSIDDTLAAYPTITSAVLVSEESEVRWTLSNGSTGIVLVWDYENKFWFTREYADAATGGGSTAVVFVDAALIDGVYTMLTAGGQVYQETTSHKLDNGTGYVGMDVVLAPISAAPGRAGVSVDNLAWYRMKDITVLGTSVKNHDLKISIARDYATSYEQTKTFLAGSLVTAVGPKELCRVTVTNQKCQAIKIRIQDITPTTPGTYPVSTGDGPILEGLVLRVSGKEGPAKTAAGQQG